MVMPNEAVYTVYKVFTRFIKCLSHVCKAFIWFLQGVRKVVTS